MAVDGVGGSSFSFGPGFGVGLGLVSSGGEGEGWGESTESLERGLGRGWSRVKGSWDWEGVTEVTISNTATLCGGVWVRL